MLEIVVAIATIAVLLLLIAWLIMQPQDKILKISLPLFIISFVCIYAIYLVASLEPDELKTMIEQIRHIEMALGSPEKTVSESEKDNIEVARKSLVAARDIKKGEMFTYENLAVKRPGNGISPWEIEAVVGQEAKKDFPYDTLIEI